MVVTANTETLMPQIAPVYARISERWGAYLETLTDEQLAFTLDKMKTDGIVDSGISLEKGIGCFDDAKQKSFYDKMVTAGAVPAGVDLSKVYTNEFVCKSVGMELKK